MAKGAEGAKSPKAKVVKDNVTSEGWDASGQAELEKFIKDLGINEHNSSSRKRKRLTPPETGASTDEAKNRTPKDKKEKKKKGKGKGKLVEDGKPAEDHDGNRRSVKKVDKMATGVLKFEQDEVEDFLKPLPKLKAKETSKGKETNAKGKGKKTKSDSDAEPSGSLASLRKKLRVPLSSVWYDDEGTAAKTPKKLEVDMKALTALQDEATGLLNQDTETSEEMHALEFSSEDAWMKTILKDGTLGDKLAAWMLRVQESPVHRLQALDALLTYTTKRKREVLEAVDTLRELWMINLLPERKLIRWAERPFDDLPEAGKRREELLILWHFEAEIKVRYNRFLDVLEGMCHDQLPEVKTKVLGSVFELLASKPEQEQRLLGILCNKLGDPHQKVSGKSQYFLKQLVARHPAMKTVVTKEVQHVLNRPNVGEKPQYAAVTLLNQLELSRSDADVDLAKRLIDLYFQFFDNASKSGELGSKLLSAILTGVNRAHPFAGIGAEFFQKYSGILFKMVHTGSFNCAIQALLLLCQVLEGSQAVSDRYFRAVYAKILDADLLTSSKQGMFINVVFRTMKMDPSLSRVKAFVKRLLQVCTAGAPVGFTCGALYMLSRISQQRPEILAMVRLPEDIDGGEESFKDAPDEDTERKTEADDTDEDEPVANADISALELAKAADKNVYDPRKREPQYSGAEHTCLWELVPLLSHYHPSVSAFAGSFKEGKPVKYNGDPLRDFVLLRFLDKFVYKKPKAKENAHGGSVMQPKRGLSDVDMVNSEAFLKKDPSTIPEHERFFHQYFTHRASKAGHAVVNNAATDESDADAAAPIADFAHDVAPDAFAEDDDLDDVDVDDFDDGDPDEDALYAALAEEDFEDEFDDDEMDFGEIPSGSDDEDDMDHDAAKPRSNTKNGASAATDVDIGASVFASAEDFAHMLEEDSGAQDKQSKWEGKQGSSRGEPRSMKPGANRRRPSKRARMTNRA